MRKWVYDIECFHNFFCVVFLDYESSETLTFEISERRNDYSALKAFLKEPAFQIGFNSLHYDEVLLSRIIFGKDMSSWDSESINAELKGLSDKIINSERFKNPWKYKRKPWITVDLYTFWSRLIRQNMKISLKGLMGNTGWYWIQELPIDPDAMVEDQDFVLKYCVNDVGGTKHLAQSMRDRINLRKDVLNRFGISAWSKDNVLIGMDILLQEYCRLTGEDPQIIKDLRTDRKSIAFKDIIINGIEFQTEELQEVFENFKTTVVSADNANSFKTKASLGDMTLQFGVGGLHSKDKSEYITPGENCKIYASDVVSYYPNLLMSHGFYPKHLGPAFVKCYRMIYEARAHAKKTGDKVTNATYKLALNGLTGNLRNPYSWAFDVQANLGIVVNGQILLAMLAERAYLAGFKVISCNTDGIEVEVPNEREQEYLDICAKWEEIAGCELEHEEYEFIARSTVNDYLAKKVGGSVKRKGDFVIEPEKENPNQEAAGHDELIISKALNAYLVEGQDFREYIRSATDIRDFCANPKLSKIWELYWGGERIQRLSRFYVSQVGKPMWVKKVDTENIKSVRKGWDVQVVNELPPYMPGDIDYDYYEEKVLQMLNAMGLEVEETDPF